jgi:hypothetical protein
MAHEIRWFTVLKNGWLFHGELLVITSGFESNDESCRVANLQPRQRPHPGAKDRIDNIPFNILKMFSNIICTGAIIEVFNFTILFHCPKFYLTE